MHQEQPMIQKGPLLAEGRTAEIYEWGEDRVLKLYREGWSARSAEYEYRQALASQKTGYPVPAVGELVQVDGRHGIIYQRVEGRTMLEEIMKKPWKVFSFGRQLAQLHAEMHVCRAADLVLVNQRLAEKIQRTGHIDEQTKASVLAHLAALPQEDKLLHGDFHPDNIMLTADGPMIIDWIDAAIGHPLADVARTLVIARVGIPPGNPLLTLFGKAFLTPYQPTYFKHSPYAPADLDAWMLPVAAARLEENIPLEIDPLLRLVKELLQSLT
jgi:aminoglycoside phosphotransferase (APT) family kinase protein